MTVKDFGVFVENTRREFSEQLRMGDAWQDDLKEFIYRRFELCTNQFEEDTLVENLAEEYKLYLKELAKNEGE